MLKPFKKALSQKRGQGDTYGGISSVCHPCSVVCSDLVSQVYIQLMFATW